jgi:osmotically-inducible protein OsmY
MATYTQTHTTRTDAQIQQDVIGELKWDPRVDETDVGVEVKDGVVTLTGSVDSWTKKLAAAEAAHRVFGVLDVANDVHVLVAGEHTDTDIAKAVRHALRWDVLVPDDKISSTVANGIVTLTGTVATAAQREDAGRAVRNLVGVRTVNNAIAIVPVKVLAADVKRAIEEALERQIEREAKRIEVTVTDGDVRLSGHVRSWAERQAAAGAAMGIPGVRSVEVRLLVSSGL